MVDFDVLAVENGKLHRTDKYAAVDNGTLVVRRGDNFNIMATFNRKVNFKKDKISFVFQAGKLIDYVFVFDIFAAQYNNFVVDEAF